MSTGTVAFFSDTESSTDNVFTAGAVDLLVDNESYYNGNVCAPDVDDINDNQDIEEYVWQGDASYPEPGTSCATSFVPSNLDGLLFFDFTDLKPDDEGEDTISIHVQNDAWVCMDLTLTSNDDNSSTEPELGTGDDEEDDGDPWDGELAEGIQFFWWADDGDNVFEAGEPAITNGVVSLATLDETFPIALSDSENNVWGDDGEPVPGGETVYLAKAWCMGDLSLDPVLNDGGVNPSVDPGVDCDGTDLGNEYQTDGAELNIIFSAIQARHNDEYLCSPPEEPLPTLTVNKILTVSTGNLDVTDFELHINGPDGDQIVTDEIPVPDLPVGDYNVYEVLVGDAIGVDFDVTFGGACDENGDLTLGLGDDVVCTITNVEII